LGTSTARRDAQLEHAGLKGAMREQISSDGPVVSIMREDL